MNNALQMRNPAPGRTAALASNGNPNPVETETNHAVNPLMVTALALYVFLLVSRVLDVSPIWFLHIPLLLLVVLVFALFAQGDLSRAFSMKITRYFGAFTGWVVICFPLSAWRGGSVNSVIYSVQAFIIYLIMVQLIRNLKDWRKVAGAYAYGVLGAGLLSFHYGQYVEGRLALANGTLADPNEFALILVIGLPLWWMKAANSSPVKKAIFMLATAPMFIAFARSGSRAGLLALGAVFLFVLWFASAGQKVLIGALALIAIVAGMAFLPDYLKVRFVTIFTPTSADLAAEQLDQQSRDRLSASIDSGEERQALLRQSINMTFRHPIFGIGPGVFPEISWEERKQETGSGGMMLVTHNTYTQISSETGLPGFFLFAGTLFLCVKYTLKDFRAQMGSKSELAQSCLYILTVLAGLIVGIFFLSMGYSNLLAALFGLAASLHQVATGASEENVVEAVSVPASPIFDPQSTSTLPRPRPRRFGRLAQATTPSQRRSRGKGTDWYSRLVEPEKPEDGR